MIGNGENRAFSKTVEDWRPLSYKSVYDNLGCLTEMGLVNANWEGLPILWEPVYQWYCVGLETSDAKRLEIPSSRQDELYLVSSRDWENLVSSSLIGFANTILKSLTLEF